MSSPLYHLRQAVLCLRQSPYAALVAASTVAIALGLSGCSLLAVRSMAAILRSYGTDARITVFIAPSVKDTSSLVARAAMAAGLGARAEFVPPKIALERLRDDLGPAGKSLNDLLENPLPPSIEVRLSSAALTRGDLREIHEAAERLRVLPGVTEVDDGASFIKRLEAILLAVKTGGLILFLTVLGIALFLVGNVVRLTVFTRRDEIDILRLVGATDAFIATPFALEGTLQGLGGGVLAAVLVHLGETVALPRAAASFGFARDFLPPSLPWTGLVLIALVGGMMGLIASLVAVLRFLRRAP